MSASSSSTWCPTQLVEHHEGKAFLKIRPSHYAIVKLVAAGEVNIPKNGSLAEATATEELKSALENAIEQMADECKGSNADADAAESLWQQPGEEMPKAKKTWQTTEANASWHNYFCMEWLQHHCIDTKQGIS